VPNSPFRVAIVDTLQELRRLDNDPDVDGMEYGMNAVRAGSEFGTMSNLGGGGGFDFDDY